MHHRSLRSLSTIASGCCLGLLLVAGCGDDSESPSSSSDGDASSGGDAAQAGPPAGSEPTYTEDRAECADRDPLRNAYFGDLHVHTSLSFDAYGWGVRNDPADAYRFAKGEEVSLPTPGEDGGERTAQLDRPLDFAAVTDHAEYFGEVQLCQEAGAEGYDTEPCKGMRRPGSTQFIQWSTNLLSTDPSRFAEICGEDGSRCLTRSKDVWERVQEAAERAYDRSESCEFTSMIGYEYTNLRNSNNLHRNVLFRNDEVPDEAVSAFEEPRPRGLWKRLRESCLEAEGNCDVLAIPHNSNLSSGEMFAPQYPGTGSTEERRARAETRSELEPLMEIFQHKGSMECSPRTSLLGSPDEFCNFEKVYDDSTERCDGTGSGGILGLGCVSPYNYYRNVLAVGMRERQKLGVNPFKLGVVASTDTHNATPGNVAERDWPGHFGLADAQPDARLDSYKGFRLTSAGVIKSPGGLAGVWAVENSRDAIFEALKRRETFGTSGPRITVRLFGGWNYPDDLCDAPDMVEQGYDGGVPMGGDLPAPPETDGDGAPTFVVSALKDPGTDQQPGVPLQRIQIVKGTVGPDGEMSASVYDVAGDPDNGASVDPETCERSGEGADSLCTVWTDPDFEPGESAYYYARVLQNPTCRWHTRLCNSLPEGERNEQCDNEQVQDVIQERAWTSPIWYQPEE